jgi:hypothetical protein
LKEERSGRKWQIGCRGVFYYSSPVSPRVVRIALRDGGILFALRTYLFGSIAETLLLDSHKFPRSLENMTIVDVGTGLGDFVLAVQSSNPKRIYAIEPNSKVTDGSVAICRSMGCTWSSATINNNNEKC